MGHGKLTYLDIPQVRRYETGSRALGRLKESLANPVLTNEQRTVIFDRIKHLDKWISGKLGTTHSVEVSEEVVITEDGGG